MRDGKRSEGRFDANTGITVSNSGLNSPIADMVKYLKFLTGDMTKNDVYDGVLKRSSLEEMWKPQLPTPVDANGNIGFTTDIGLIFFSTPRRPHISSATRRSKRIHQLLSISNPRRDKPRSSFFNTNVIYPDGTPVEKDVVGRLRNEVRKLY
jgi:hypothetical protein